MTAQSKTDGKSADPVETTGTAVTEAEKTGETAPAEQAGTQDWAPQPAPQQQVLAPMPGAAPQASLERGFRVEVKPMRKILADMQAVYDSEVLIDADPMASRYPRVKKTLEEFIAKRYGEDIYIGFFAYEDLDRVTGLGYYVMSTTAFEVGEWTDVMAARLGVTIDAANALRVGNKYVCFILRRLRDDRLVKSWEAASEKLSAAAKAAASTDQPGSVQGVKIEADFDEVIETIQHKKRKRAGRR